MHRQFHKLRHIILFFGTLQILGNNNILLFFFMNYVDKIYNKNYTIIVVNLPNINIVVLRACLKRIGTTIETCFFFNAYIIVTLCIIL